MAAAAAAASPEPPCRSCSSVWASGEHTEPVPSEASGTCPSRPRNYSWAELMRRVFAVDVLECPRCQGRMRILAAIHRLAAVRAILECLGLPSRAPPIAEPEAEPEATDWAIC